MEPNNPGLSEQAWNDLHKLVAKLIHKYANELHQKNENKQPDGINQAHLGHTE